MKANEFIKKFGWENAKLAAKGLLPMDEGMPVFDYNSEDLKRLVESYELVESWGGLDDAKFALQLVRYPERLNQAIADVESCL